MESWQPKVPSQESATKPAASRQSTHESSIPSGLQATSIGTTLVDQSMDAIADHATGIWRLPGAYECQPANTRMLLHPLPKPHPQTPLPHEGTRMRTWNRLKGRRESIWVPRASSSVKVDVVLLEVPHDDACMPRGDQHLAGWVADGDAHVISCTTHAVNDRSQGSAVPKQL